MFNPNSRYASIETASITVAQPGGAPRTVAYKRRRIVPPPSVYTQVRDRLVVAGDRLDNVTAEYTGEPTEFWGLCDANNVLHPRELLATAGRAIRISTLNP